MAMLDLLISGGTVYDGSGAPGRRADVGVRGDTIVAVGDLTGREAVRTLDAAGLAVAPGFIDLHTHSDLAPFFMPDLAPKLRQGVTTDVIGLDGMAAAPIRPEHVPAWRRQFGALAGDPDVAWDWRTVGEYLDQLQAARPAINLALSAPHGSIRLYVVGPDERPATPNELRAMQALTRECLEAGCFGLSGGLIYPPGCYADTAELIEVCRVVAEFGGHFAVHVRSEGTRIEESYAEIVRVGRASGARIHFSHCKVIGARNRHKVPRILELMERATADGVPVTFEQYPYNAGSTMLSAVLPPWAHSGGTEALLARLRDPAQRERMRREIADPDAPFENMVDHAGWDRIYVSSVVSEANAGAVGRTIGALAAERRVDPLDYVADLLLAEEGRVGMVLFTMDEAQIAEIMRSPFHLVGSDGLLGGSPHPRVYGTFPRVLGRYVREQGVLPLETAINHMTGASAASLGLRDRGLIREGLRADLVVFDPATVLDTATYEQPRQYPVGIPHVVVNGRLAVENGELTGERAGTALRAR